jgi:diaminopimelate decarboxylase
MTKTVFAFRNGVLCAEALPLIEIAQEMNTPFFCTSLKQLHRNLETLKASTAHLPLQLAYKMKTNGTLAVIRTFAKAGAGIVVSSAAELARALEADFLPRQISLGGERREHDDVLAAVLAGVARIDVASLAEIDFVEKIARSLERRAALVLRVDLEGALKDGLSGLHLAQAIQSVRTSRHLSFRGVAPIANAAVQSFSDHVRVIEGLAALLRDCNRQGIEVQEIGLGAMPAFLGHDGQRELSSLYVRVIDELREEIRAPLFLEAGESLVADASVLVTRVLRTYGEGKTNALLLETGVLDCSLREVLPLRLDFEQGAQGAVAAGELVAVMNMGANADLALAGSRQLIPELLVSGAQYSVIRRRVAAVEQFAWESCPGWLEGTAHVA